MVRARQTAAEFIDEHDDEMRIILGELIENAGRVNTLWTEARASSRGDPERALTLLANAYVALNNAVRVELSDSLRRIRSAMNRLDAELPDDEDPPEAADARPRYTVTAEPDGAFWLLHVEELPALVTQARFAGEIEYMSRDLIAVSQEISPSSFDLVVPGVDDRRIRQS